MTADDLSARIREIDQELAALRGELGAHSDEPKDYGDAATEITEREEHNALIETLEAERRRLVEERGD
jgi:hypothetical protein